MLVVARFGNKVIWSKHFEKTFELHSVQNALQDFQLGEARLNYHKICRWFIILKCQDDKRDLTLNLRDIPLLCLNTEVFHAGVLDMQATSH